MPLPASSRVQFTADLTICRILNGMWQVSGAHGAVDPVRAVDAMSTYHEAGFTTWDLADHYGPAEDFIGDFRRRLAARHGVDRLPEIQAFTKWVPRPGRMTRRVVEDAISISLTRMGAERLDLLQFHWWDYKNDGYLRRAQTSVRPPAKRQDPSSCAHQFRYRAPQRHRGPRGPRRLKPGAVLAHRPPP
jgi:aryl-alcohol dehydrogenase-like predicted oxidoreductase